MLTQQKYTFTTSSAHPCQQKLSYCWFHSHDILFADGISTEFLGTYITTECETTSASSAHDAHDAVDDAFLPPNKRDILLEVLMCSATVCEHCSSILYDEDIMSGWSAQDSDLNTTLVSLSGIFHFLGVGEVFT